MGEAKRRGSYQDRKNKPKGSTYKIKQGNIKEAAKQILKEK